MQGRLLHQSAIAEGSTRRGIGGREGGRVWSTGEARAGGGGVGGGDVEFEKPGENPREEMGTSRAA